MTDLALHQSPSHTVQVGETIYLDGDPFIVKAIRPQREKGVFLDFDRKVEPNEVIVTIERFDGMPA